MSPMPFIEPEDAYTYHVTECPVCRPNASATCAIGKTLLSIQSEARSDSVWLCRRAAYDYSQLPHWLKRPSSAQE